MTARGTRQNSQAKPPRAPQATDHPNAQVADAIELYLEQNADWVLSPDNAPLVALLRSVGQTLIDYPDLAAAVASCRSIFLDLDKRRVEAVVEVEQEGLAALLKAV